MKYELNNQQYSIKIQVFSKSRALHTDTVNFQMSKTESSSKVTFHNKLLAKKIGIEEEMKLARNE